MRDELRSIFGEHVPWSPAYRLATRRATEQIVDDWARWPRFVPLAFAPFTFRSKLERFRSEELAKLTDAATGPGRRPLDPERSDA